jgi:hypothetical protein
MREASEQWKTESLKWRGRVLTGEQGHWCEKWDGLPVDETTPEWPCGCRLEPETIDIIDLCDNCEETIGFFAEQRVDSEQFIVEVAKHCLAVGWDTPPPMIPASVRYVRWKYYHAPGAAEDEDWSMVPALPDDPEGFEATFIRFDGEAQ